MQMKLTGVFDGAVRDLRGLQDNDLVMFVLRHAESLGQKDIKYYKTLGDNHLPLTGLGVEQARAVGKIIDRLAFEAGIQDLKMFSSTGHRSSRTAVEIFNQQTKRPYTDFDARLDKQKFGKFDGLFTKEERAAACPEDYPVFKDEMAKLRGVFFARPPEGESIKDVQDRMVPFFEERAKSGGASIVVTHGTNALCLEDIALDRGVDWIIERLDTRPNCAIRMITGNGRDGYRARTICTDPIAMLRQLVNKYPGLTP